MLQQYLRQPDQERSSVDWKCLVWSPKSASERGWEVNVLLHRLFNELSRSTPTHVFQIAEDACRLSAALFLLADDARWDLVRKTIPALGNLIRICVEADPIWATRLEVALIERKLDAIRSWVN